MNITTIFFNNNLRNFCYLLEFGRDHNYCIDPFNASEVLKELGNKKITAIINTHDHCDHCGGNLELSQQHHCDIMTHENAQVPGKTRGLKDKEIIYQDQEWSLSALDTPGHTLSHLCVMLKRFDVPYALFTGDCFFNAGVGNCHDGDVTKQYQTISQIFAAFPDDLKIYPGHEYLKRNLEFCQSVERDNVRIQEFISEINEIDLDSIFYVNTMRVEREINCFLRLKSMSLRNHLNLLDNSDQEVFYTLRHLRNNW